ncbi:hypothetical protein QE152_g4754 [Popillia japonica]|uniref:Uncharacterized protein n=1 Tax=Popillia japonica TaxID=7064 RepID=A0AAW1MZ81_POPJA
MFLHVLDQTIWNSFVLYGKQGGSNSHLKFRLDLVQQIIEKYPKQTSGRPSGSSLPLRLIGRHFIEVKTSGRPSGSSLPLRLIGRHFIEVIPPTANKERHTRQCKISQKPYSAILPPGRIKRWIKLQEDDEECEDDGRAADDDEPEDDRRTEKMKNPKTMEERKTMKVQVEKGKLTVTLGHHGRMAEL